MIQNLQGYVKPGDDKSHLNPLETATDLTQGQGPSPWDEIHIAAEQMLKQEVRHASE